MDPSHFEEKQGFHWFAYAAVLIAIAGTIVAAVVAFTAWEEDLGIVEACWIPLLAAAGALLVLNILSMRTTIAGNRLTVQFGRFFPIYRKHIAVHEINHSRVVDYRPLRDAGGWGIRFGRFERQSCRFLNCRGNRGVLIETHDQRYIIGSQEPERLQAALDAARANGGSGSAA
ncbi:MAG TPA: hypothetical protein PLJ71_08775 [Candidatus Hydrogenedentes bacterium]|nr:hypothetical protein [Candidatus Hydrogenedentota bacterium]